MSTFIYNLRFQRQQSWDDQHRMLSSSMIWILKPNIRDNNQNHLKSLWNFHERSNTTMCQFSNICNFISKVNDHTRYQLDKVLDQSFISHYISKHLNQQRINQTKNFRSWVLQTFFQNNSKQVQKSVFTFKPLFMSWIKEAEAVLNVELVKFSKSWFTIFNFDKFLHQIFSLVWVHIC